MTAELIGLGWTLAVVAFLALVVGLCKAAALGDDIGHAFGHASSAEINCGQHDDFAFGVCIAMDEWHTLDGWTAQKEAAVQLGTGRRATREVARTNAEY